jgi:iron complex transport system substrate-binding protein
MDDDSSGHKAPTRREYMKYGGAVVGGGLLAGCL